MYNFLALSSYVLTGYLSDQRCFDNKETFSHALSLINLTPKTHRLLSFTTPCLVIILFNST